MFAGSVSWLSLATLVHNPTAAVAAMLLGSLSTACSDVVVDSLVVERARGEPAVSCAAGTGQQQGGKAGTSRAAWLVYYPAIDAVFHTPPAMSRLCQLVYAPGGGCAVSTVELGRLPALRSTCP
jgi:hypothetical protein